MCWACLSTRQWIKRLAADPRPCVCSNILSAWISRHHDRGARSQARGLHQLGRASRRDDSGLHRERESVKELREGYAREPFCSDSLPAFDRSVASQHPLGVPREPTGRQRSRELSGDRSKQGCVLFAQCGKQGGLRRGAGLAAGSGAFEQGQGRSAAVPGPTPALRAIIRRPSMGRRRRPLRQRQRNGAKQQSRPGDEGAGGDGVEIPYGEGQLRSVSVQGRTFFSP